MNGYLAFFGAFNPPTSAHIALAEYAMKQTGASGVIFVPSQSVYIENEQKKDFSFSDEKRYGMLKEIAAGRSWMSVTDWELKQPSQPRSYETLCHLDAEGIHAALLMGSDKLPELEGGWLFVEEIAQRFGIVCMSRSGDDVAKLLSEDPYLKTLAPYIRIVDAPEQYQEVSSTKVRDLLYRLKELRGQLNGLLPEELLRDPDLFL